MLNVFEGCNQVNVELRTPAVYQSFDEVKGFNNLVNAEMIYFLRIYGVEEEYRLSIFAQIFKSIDHLRNTIAQFFHQKVKNRKWFQILIRLTWNIILLKNIKWGILEVNR